MTGENKGVNSLSKKSGNKRVITIVGLREIFSEGENGKRRIISSFSFLFYTQVVHKLLRE
jgi:hypothetical protein